MLSRNILGVGESPAVVAGEDKYMFCHYLFLPSDGGTDKHRVHLVL